MNEMDEELAQLFDEAVARLSTYRYTFTDDALRPIWERGYDVSPQSDPRERFVLAYEADGKHPRQWRLNTQALANNRLLDALRSGRWDGQDLEAELARLDTEDQVHYVFCPGDPRFMILPDSTLEPADLERNVVLHPETRAALDALGPRLLEQWRAEYAEPLTVRQLTERLEELGWSEASARNGWLLVRSWLLGWSEVTRVGQDYWIPSDQIPKESERTRLQVLPVSNISTPIEASDAEIVTGSRSDSPEQEVLPTISKPSVIPGKAVITQTESWKFPLRTIHLLEGFVPIPPNVRSAYPPRAVGEGDREVLRGLWYDNDEPLWLWLDRVQDRLYGPDLAHKLEWLEAGDVLHGTWTPDVVVLRITGHDDEVQREESRLVDPDALKALRGGIGETYRQSIQTILAGQTDGLTFAQVVIALRERQGHDVHRGTVRTLLYAGGFVQGNGRWFAALRNEVGARKLRAALVETLVPVERGEEAGGESAEGERQLKRVRAIRERLGELGEMIRENMQEKGKVANDN
jgi:hypothetical protein